MSGPDSPVSRREDDLLRRWNLAKTIYDLVRACPRDWSPRVGLYGGWGEGKTSVLNFIDSLARADGIPVLWFSPWSAQDRVELWTAFSSGLERRLGYRPGGKRRAFRWVGRQWRRWTPFLRAATTVPAGTLPAELPAHSAEILKGVLSLTETLLPSLSRDAPPQRQDVEHQLLAVPGDARLIVVIDDIDRGNAELMPHLLLALREVFDLPGCAFIVAFDPRTIADALPAAHPGWRPTPEFLEKIIQFPFWLPAPTRQDVLALAQEEAKEFPGVVVDADALSEVADLLPANPRRLKEFFRGLWRLRPTLARHDASELKWMPIFLIELMRSLSQAATQALLQDAKFRGDLGEATFFFRDPTTELGAIAVKELRDHAKTILTDAKCPDDVREGMLRLVDAFRDRASMVAGSSIAYWAQLDDRPPIFTWKEFNALVSSWRQNPSADRLAELVETQMRLVGCVAETAYRELFETAVMYRGEAINRAAEVVVDEQIGIEMDKADIGLALLRIVIHDQKGFSRQPGILTAEHFTQLLEQFGHWAHFRNHARYLTAREGERELLLEAATDGARFASETIESLRPWNGLFGGLSPERTELKQAVVQVLSAHVFDDLLARFSRKDGIAALWGRDRHLVEKHYLFRRDGGFYSEARTARLKDIANQAKTSLVVQENFYEYLRLLGYGLKGGGSETLTTEELRPLAQDAEIVLSAWRAATAQPLQPRVVADLRETRAVLGKELPEGQVLTLPPWWPTEPQVEETAEEPTTAPNPEPPE
jgi:hypothetical protein